MAIAGPLLSFGIFQLCKKMNVNRKVSVFLAAFLGVVTGVGGGMLRDIMANQTPYVLRKHFYACASIIGAVCYIFLRELIPGNSAMLLCAFIVVIIRLLATRYRWNLPRASGKSKDRR